MVNISDQYNNSAYESMKMSLRLLLATEHISETKMKKKRLTFNILIKLLLKCNILRHIFYLIKYIESEIYFKQKLFPASTLTVRNFLSQNVVHFNENSSFLSNRSAIFILIHSHIKYMLHMINR